MEGKQAFDLDIRSPQPQCGKSVCLKLLELLTCEPALVTAADPNTLFHRLLEKRSLSEIKKNMENSNRPRFPLTFLIDDCHHSFGPSERQPIVALLNCGADVNARYSHGQEEYFVACPKAFAGNAGLPASLASRCIPIVLRRRKFSDQLNRFVPDELLAPANALKQWLKHWTDEISPRLQETGGKPIQFPPALTPRQQQCAEPLLRLANIIGGSWPARARAALMAAFGISECSRSSEISAISSYSITNPRNFLRVTSIPTCATSKIALGPNWERYAGLPATVKFRSRAINSIRFRSFRDLATWTPSASAKMRFGSCKPRQRWPKGANPLCPETRILFSLERGFANSDF